ELTRLRLAGGPMHTGFAAAVLYPPPQHGPPPTTELPPRVEAMPPNLCDKSVDRGIDGQRLGQKWKHAVGTAQQQLKKRDRLGMTVAGVGTEQDQSPFPAVPSARVENPCHERAPRDTARGEHEKNPAELSPLPIV